MKPTAYGVATLLIAVLLTAPGFAHCDTMDGPVITAAKTALASGNVNHVLVWVQPGDETAIKEAFEHARDERTAEAEMAFFETLVRLHREGEGAAYTGVKPAGQVEPIVQLTDHALEEGNIELVVQPLSGAMQQSIRQKYAELEEREGYAVDDVDAGRDYVAHYVGFMHYVEGIDVSVHASGHAHGAPATHEDHAEAASHGHEESRAVAGWAAAGVVSLSAAGLFLGMRKKK